jgi:hypothetical protein
VTLLQINEIEMRNLDFVQFNGATVPAPGADSRAREGLVWTVPVLLVTGVALLIASCNGQQQARCYKIVESTFFSDGGQSLRPMPCPPGQTGILRDES